MKQSIIGLPREIKAQEHRVALTPPATWQLVKNGHTVMAERDAGIGSGFLTSEYEQAGCRIIDTAAEIFATTGLIVKVKEPQPAEVAMLPARADPFHLPAPRRLARTHHFSARLRLHRHRL